jgi:hypothetical protein
VGFRLFLKLVIHRRPRLSPTHRPNSRQCPFLDDAVTFSRGCSNLLASWRRARYYPTIDVSQQLPNVAPQRRSQRVTLRMLITASGISAQGPFSEEAHTLVVSAHGALVALAAQTSPGDLLKLQNHVTSEIRTCRVVCAGPTVEGKNQTGLEFAEPAPHFWQIAFPPADWTPSEGTDLSKRLPSSNRS